MIRGLYAWVLSLAGHRHALWALGLIAFAESSVFPIPPDILMIPMIVARPSRAFLIAAVALAASVAGGVFGYVIGAFLFDAVGRPVLDFYGAATEFDVFARRYNDWGAWAVLIGGVTPFPYKIITILSGSTGLNFWVFLISSVIARGLRFFILAGLLWRFGEPIRDFIEKRLGLMFTLFVVILAAGFYAVKFL
jgi:membrane protein YqaA with SNARE-associated domain